MPYIKLSILLLFALCTIYIHYRGRQRLGFWRQLTDHSTFMAPINCFCYLFSTLPARPYLPLQRFPELQALNDNWQRIRAEALALSDDGAIKASDRYDDLGFNSFFKTGWKRFYLKWYDQPHPSAAKLCPYTTALLQSIPSVKAAMFASLPPGSRLVRHRDPFAGSVRFHLGLSTPQNEACYIEVDGERYSWRDGEAVMFDETYLHHAENATAEQRIILFCDIERPMRFRLAAWVNRQISRLLLGAASSPNQDGDRTGALNRLFRYVQAVRLFGKRIKAQSRLGYYALKWLLFGGLLLGWLLS